MGAVVSWTRLLVKLVWMIVLMLLLVTFAKDEVDFVYRGF
jgi:hypothetical protein